MMKTIPGTSPDFWANQNALLNEYYQTDWGHPKHSEREVFELLVMEQFSAGLNWLMILSRRDQLRRAFADYDLPTLAAWTDVDQERALQAEGMIKNHLKIAAVPNNARATLALRPEFKNLADYVWSFTEGEQIIHAPASAAETPTQDELSQRGAKDMKKRGFKFVGPVIVYNYLQACGVIDDHIVTPD